MSTAGDFRLPRTVVPARYELRLEPDLDAATFSGECSTEVEVVERTEEIVLNAAELQIDEAWLEGPKGVRIAADVRLDPEAERAHLALAKPADRLAVSMANSIDGDRVFGAAMVLDRRPITARSLASVLLRFPLQTFKIILAIYWEALRLWVKRCPFYSHPDQKGEVVAP